MNLITLSDSYKVSHHKQYPPGAKRLYSYWESRGGLHGETVFFGLQWLVKKYLTTPITMEDIDEAEELFAAHFGRNDLFNREGWEIIVNEYSGLLPLEIKSVPEGTAVPVSNVMVTVENADGRLPWLTNYMETLLCQLWYPTTVATISREVRKTIDRYLEYTGDPAGAPFKLHDFGFRGVSSVESAAIGGAAHLINFMGTDTMAALTLIRDYYDMPMAGFSIPAAEHSTITSWGGPEGEIDAFRNMIDQFGGKGTDGGGLYAVVSDSYDIYKACQTWGGELLEEVRAAPNMLVVRPDSGDPVEVVRRVIYELDKGFGHIQNDKGFRVLNGVRVIQGDGVDPQTIEAILDDLMNSNWSADNIAFGMGGALLQKLNRDTQKFAFKASSISGDFGERDVWKEPVTSSMKESKRGRLALVENDGTLETVRWNAKLKERDLLRTVFRNGQLVVQDTFESIRERAAS